VKAVILAAGRGRRLGDLTADRPKCLVPIGASTLLGRQVHTLRACGVSTIAVVAGFRTDDLRQACDPRIEIVVNESYDSTNSLYSLWLARHLLTEPFVVLNADVLFHEQLLRDLLTSCDEDALLMAAVRGDQYGQEEMKVRVRAGCVSEISKTMRPARADGENVGIVKFGAEGVRVLVDEMKKTLEDGGRRAWLPRAFARFSRRRPLHVVETRGYPWIEIDSPEDYWRACAEVLPAIMRIDQSRPDSRALSTATAGAAGGVTRRA
jgi:choline kinase